MKATLLVTPALMIGIALILAIIVSKNEAVNITLNYVYHDVQLGTSTQNLMLGSSSIRRLQPDAQLACGKWLNRGIGRAKITDIKRYIEWTPLTINPNHVLLYAGENDIKAGLSTKETIIHYQALVQQLLNQYPESTIHILAIKPSPSQKKFWPAFESINQFIEYRATNSPRMVFHRARWDSNDHSHHDAAPNTAFLEDGTHLTENGYTIFLAGINQLCNQL